MSGLTKLLTVTLAGAAALGGWSYVKNLKRAQAALQVIPKVSLQQLGWDGLTIRLDVLLKNPSKASFSVRFPFVNILYKETVIGSSQVSDKMYKLPQFGELLIDKIMIQVPMTSAFSVVFTLIKALYSKQPVTLTVKTLTDINLGWIVLPYENKRDVTINNKP